jgi:hypothetical protein
MQTKSNLTEGLEINDLKRLVHTELHIDEFKSKLGRDEDIIVLSFKLTGRAPASDLVDFLEKATIGSLTPILVLVKWTTVIM